MKPRFRRLRADDDLSGFDCGVDSLNTWLGNLANFNEQTGLSRTRLLVNTSGNIMGYQSLSAGSIPKEHLPKKHIRRYPGYPIPIILLGRLAVDQKFKGNGYGHALMMDALNETCKATDHVGATALIVDALDDAKDFYVTQFAFRETGNNPSRLWLPLSTIRSLVTA